MFRQKESLETVEEELARRLKSLVERDPTLVATLEKVALKEAEPISSAIDFLGSRFTKPGWPDSLMLVDQ